MCVYFAEISMEGRVFTLHDKIVLLTCVENQWHVPALALQSLEVVSIAQMEALSLNTQIYL